MEMCALKIWQRKASGSAKSASYRNKISNGIISESIHIAGEISGGGEKPKA